jgi:hypothetical protein
VTRRALKFNRVERGWQASECGHYAVVADGYEPSKSISAEGDYEGFQGGEWAALYFPNGNSRTNADRGERLDWVPTMREAKAYCQGHHDYRWGR